MTSPAEAIIRQPRPRPIVGNVPDLDRDAPVQSLVRLARELGPIFRMEFPGEQRIFLGSHELVADACDESRFEKHVHGPLKHIRDFAGDGLFTAHGDEPNWGKAHRILLPVFGPSAMRGYFEEMLDIADQMLTKWERLGPEENIDVADNMTRLTLDTIALCGFAYRFNSFYQREPHPFVESMVRALGEAGRRSRRLPVQTRLMRAAQRQYEADGAYMHRVCDELIARRKKLAAQREDAPRDLLGLMLSAKDPVTGERLDDANIRHQLVTFLIAGHETTSGLLSFATYLLLAHPDVLARAQAEVDDALGSEPPRFEDLARLGYVDQILRETLRLYPTAPAFAVHAKQDTRLAGRYPIEAGEILMVLSPVLHRDPSAWKDPERFDPDRFSPAARQQIPQHAWLPFGNGQRSCIGRAFALQEATLVLSMLLQRFELSFAAPYELRIKETLTLKPEGLQVRARRRREQLARSTPSRGASTVASPPGRPEAHGAPGTPLLVLYGSNSGASEGFARRIAGEGVARGYAARVAPLDEGVDRLPKDGAVVIVTASYNGQPPDNARAFVSWLSGTASGSLAGVRYAVFGCGSRDWSATYQAIPKLVDEKLRGAGARALLERGEADATDDFFGDFERWYARLLGTLDEQLGVSPAASASASACGPLYRVEVVGSPGGELVTRNQLAAATVVENRELVDVSKPNARSKRHIEIELPEGVTYAAGDYLAVLPENHPDWVDRAVRRLGLSPDATVVLHSTRGEVAASLPTGRPVSIQELLGRHVELSAPATRKDLERLAAKTPCPPHREQLLAVARDDARYQAEILQKRVSVLDLLERYPAIELGLADYLELLPPMRVRQYSISSSPRGSASRCTVTVAVVEAPALSGVGRFHGICSTYLQRLRPGDRVAVSARSPNGPFRPPADNAAPIVMICAGTGLAPFRGFLQERAIRRAAGEPAGEALLFFGCDHPEVDFLYRDELARWEAEGLVTVLPAFTFQVEDGVQFVQHRVWKERERVRESFRRGATVYVCGDGRHMAPAVREALVSTYREASGCSEAEARAWAEEVERQGRYVSDVFA